MNAPLSKPVTDAAVGRGSPSLLRALIAQDRQALAATAPPLADPKDEALRREYRAGLIARIDRMEEELQWREVKP